MPRLSIQQTNFTAGELSPRLYGRTDIDRYSNAAKTLINAHPVVHGGAKRRAGTRFIGDTKFSGAKRSRLIPFIYSRDAAYMLECGENYVRVWPAGGGAMVQEIATSYTETMLVDIDYAQGADTMWMAHPTVPMQRVRRFASGTFDVSAAPFLTTPFDEQGHTLPANLTLSAATVGTGRTVAADAAVFLPSDVGRNLVSAAGLATVTAYTDTQHVTVTISIAFGGTSILSGAWHLDVSPQAILLPSAKDPVASSITLTPGLSRAANLTLSAVSGAITVTASASVFAPGDVGKKIFADSGVALISGYTSGTQVSATTLSDFLSTSYAQGGYGITDAAWRASDVGKYVRLNGGMCKITAFTSSSLVTATVQTALTSVVACPPLAWSLEDSVWSAANGYPRTVTEHEQRLIAAGSTKYPQTIWGSRTGVFLDFMLGANDDDAYSFTLAADEINPISYVASGRNLIVHTYGGEFSLQGGVEKPITPTNVRIRPETAHGSKGVRPVNVGKESIFVQRAGRKVRALSYRYDVDGFLAPDLSVLAEHITEGGGITAMAYQQEPDMLVWAVRADGVLLSCTLDREQQVTGWAKHYTEGAFESVATIPNGDREETWVIVKRTVNGADVRYIELLDETFQPLNVPAPAGYPPLATTTVYGYTVDCGVDFSFEGGFTTVNAPHLIGKTVDIVADGLVQAQKVVPPSGIVTLDRTAYRALLGLHFRTEIAPLTPEVGTSTGTAQGNSMRTSEVTVRFLNTGAAAVYDGDGNAIGDLSFRSFGPDLLDQPLQLFTGVKRIEKLGWERGRDEIVIVQDLPLPMHVLSITRKFQVND
jgi:hypothetical protein